MIRLAPAEVNNLMYFVKCFSLGFSEIGHGKIDIVTDRIRSLGEGNVFTGVCHSVHGWVGGVSGGCVSQEEVVVCRRGGVGGCIPSRYAEISVNRRLVRILLECILVWNDCFYSNTFLKFFPDAKLEAFGSSCNGFGFRESDLDLCLTFTKSDPMVNQSFANSCISNHNA